MKFEMFTNRLNKDRRIVLITALVVLAAALIVGGTLAYFTGEETAYNVITTGNLVMTLHEETTGGVPFPEDGIDGVMPGDKVDKKVYLSNDGNVDMYARIGVKTVITPDTLDLKYIKLDIDTEHWTEKDGYYYYSTVLAPGEKTEPLFTQVQFDPAMPNEYQNCRVEVDVNAQSVQSKNNGTTALDAIGWPEA